MKRVIVHPSLTEKSVEHVNNLVHWRMNTLRLAALMASIGLFVWMVNPTGFIKQIVWSVTGIIIVTVSYALMARGTYRDVLAAGHAYEVSQIVYGKYHTLLDRLRRLDLSAEPTFEAIGRQLQDPELPLRMDEWIRRLDDHITAQGVV